LTPGNALPNQTIQQQWTLVKKFGLSATARRTQTRREARRASIVQGARKCFQEVGYNLATVEDVLKYAEISRGTYYSYFTSKSSVVIAIIQSIEPDLMELYGELGTLSAVSREDLEAWLGKLIEFFGRHPDVLEIWNSALRDAEFMRFMRGFGNRMAHKMGLEETTMSGEFTRGMMFSSLMLSQLGQFCSIVTMTTWSRQREQAVNLMAEIMYRSFVQMAREDAELTGPDTTPCGTH
jgi:AcrR family transcriptional regulator